MPSAAVKPALSALLTARTSREDASKRTSRSPTRDFEEMLKSGDTVIFREGRDETGLGGGNVNSGGEGEQANGQQKSYIIEEEEELQETLAGGNWASQEVGFDSSTSRKARLPTSSSAPLLSLLNNNSSITRSSSTDVDIPRRVSLDLHSGTGGSGGSSIPSKLVSSRNARASTSSKNMSRGISSVSAGLSNTTVERERKVSMKTPAHTGSSQRRSFDSTHDLDEMPQSAFQTTMRKTSQFFRKFGGSSKTSVPTAPIQGQFISSPSVPPVPAQFVASSLPVSTLRPSPSRQGFTTSAPPVLELQLPGKTNPRTRKNHPRQRSISMDAAFPTAMIKEGGEKMTPGRSRESTTSSNEPSDWKTDLDGVIGAIGVSTSPSLPSSPSFPSVRPFSSSSRSVSQPPPLSINLAPDNSTPTEAPILSKVDSPLEALFRLPDNRRSSHVEVESDAQDQQSAQPFPPRIQLLAPQKEVDGFEGSLRPTKSISSAQAKRHSVAIDVPSLETISETTHSRESSSNGSSGSPLTPTAFLPLLIPLPPSRSSTPLSDVKDEKRATSPTPNRSPTFPFSLSLPTPVPAIATLAVASSSGDISIRSDMDPKDIARKCWEEHESFMDRTKFAEYLGSNGSTRASALQLYMDNFDFTNLRLDVAFRRLCEKLYLKAESQQVDRILAQFSRRYWENNPQSIYGSFDAVYAVSYAILLLNTDLHVADIPKHMSRQAFVDNTISTITGASPPSESTSSNLKPSKLSLYSVFGGGDSMRSLDRQRDGLPWSTSTQSLRLTNTSVTNLSPSRNVSGSSENYNEGSMTSRPSELGVVLALKEIYNAIKAQPVAQSMRASSSTSLEGRSPVSVAPGGTSYGGNWTNMHRSPSRRSASSVTSSSVFKRSSIRGMNSFGGSSEMSRSTSPTPSTSTSISDENISTAYARQTGRSYSTIGFASNLSHTMVIREQREDDDAPLDDDAVPTEEELALSGAPWAKEGIIQRKHFWETPLRRAKDKNWLSVFVVISKGELRMFRFDGAGTTKGTAGGAGVGGGDWMANANSVGQLSLVHALSSALAPPGYNKSRPHCFVLTLPEGGSYFFEAGTQDLIGEWVSTCNYWSARYSKQPLSGGVSNMEYGWNLIPDENERQREEEMEDIASLRSVRSGRSVRSEASRRSKFSYRAGSGANGSSSGGGGTLMNGNVTAGDRIHINDWKPPNVPTGASTLSEDAQLENLKRHTRITRAELSHHNTLRGPMLRLFTSNSANYRKADDNWKRKSYHLLAEAVKYQTYVEALTSAIKLKALRTGQREVEQMLEAADGGSPAAG